MSLSLGLGLGLDLRGVALGPSPTASPIITGDPTDEGNTLTLTQAPAWTGADSSSYIWQWYDAGAWGDVAGSTDTASIVVQAGENTGSYRVKATATNAEGTTIRYSNSLTAVSLFLLQATNDFAKAPSTSDVAWVGSTYQQKMDQTIDVDGTGAITGYDFTLPNAMHAANLSAGYNVNAARWHPFIWHKGYPLSPAEMAITSANWQTIIDDYADQIAANALGAADIQYWEINEVIANGNQDNVPDDYWTKGDWYLAAQADGTWANPDEYWWWYAIEALDGFIATSAEVALVDYNLEYGASHQPAAAPSELTEISYAVHRWERMRKNVIDTNLARDAATISRGIDSIAYQMHAKPDQAFSDTLLTWQAREIAALGLKADFTEINIEIEGYTALGLTGTLKETYGKAFLKALLRPFVETGVARFFQFWTDVTDAGAGNADPGHDDNGDPTYVSDAVRELLAESITADTVKGGMLWLCGRSAGHYDWDVSGTITGINGYGAAGTDLTVPLSHWYQDVAGTLTPMDGDAFEICVFVEASSGPSSGEWLVAFQTAASATVFAVIHDGSNFVLRAPSGDTALPLAVGVNEHHKFTFQWDGADLKFVQSRYDGGVISNAAAGDVITQAETVGTAITKIALNNHARTLYLTGVFTQAASDTELAARNEIAANEGACYDADDFGWYAPTPPTNTLQADGLTVLVTFGAELDQGYNTAPGEWVVYADATPKTIYTAALDANPEVVEIVLSQQIYYGQTVTLDYTGTNLRDTEGAIIGTISGGSVTNSSGVPAAFGSGDWTLTDAGSGGTLTVTPLSVPAGANGISYSVNGGTVQHSGGITAFNITGLTDGVSYGVRIRATISGQAGPYNGPKNATPTTSGASDALLLETGDSLLLETGDALLLE